MLYRLLRNDVQREGVKASPDLASGLFCYIPLHKIWYGVHSTVQVTEIYLKDFRSSEARKEHTEFSPIGEINLRSKKKHHKEEVMDSE